MACKRSSVRLRYSPLKKAVYKLCIRLFLFQVISLACFYPPHANLKRSVSFSDTNLANYSTSELKNQIKFSADNETNTTSSYAFSQFYSMLFLLFRFICILHYIENKVFITKNAPFLNSVFITL